jgi:hypothetical protein
MEKIAVFVNDAAHARHLLQPMLAATDSAHWVLVACPPTLTRHVGRWVTKQARLAWRVRWSDELFAQLEPELKAQAGSQVERLLASKPLIEVSARLKARLPGVRLLDARRPALGRHDEPLTATQPADSTNRWAGTVAAATGLTAVLALAD